MNKCILSYDKIFWLGEEILVGISDHYIERVHV